MDHRLPRTPGSLALMATLTLTLTTCGGRTASPPQETTPTHSATVSPIGSVNSPQHLRATGKWHLLPSAPFQAPFHSFQATWDGTEVVINARVTPHRRANARDFTQVVAYQPHGDAWRTIAPHPQPRWNFEDGDTAVWDGRELILWGITDAAYNPATNAWRDLPPGGRGGGPDIAVWTGHQALGFGGGCCGEFRSTYLAYTPSTNSWDRIPDGPLEGRWGAAGVWTGKELIIAGGWREVISGPGNVVHNKYFADAAAYNPVTRSWRSLPRRPKPRLGATAVWDGTEMLVVGGTSSLSGEPYARGLAFSPSTNRWRRLRRMEFPRAGNVAVWTGHEMLVWGGWRTMNSRDVAPPHGEAFDPISNLWSALPVSPLRARVGAAAVWTGTQMIIWGGESLGGRTFFADGAAFRPGTR